VRENPYTDMILLSTFLRNQDDPTMDLTELAVTMVPSLPRLIVTDHGEATMDLKI